MPNKIVSGGPSAVKIAIIGAPGSGKTTLLTELRKRHNREVTVAFLEEAASKLIRFVPTLRHLSPAFFQASIAAIQMQAEEAVLSSWEENRIPDGILICDRGVHDFYCYANEEQANCLQVNFACTPYDLVIYLDGIFQGRSGNQARTESAAEVELLREKTREVWRNAANVYLEIPYCESFTAKVDLVAETINRFFDKPIFTKY